VPMRGSSANRKVVVNGSSQRNSFGPSVSNSYVFRLARAGLKLFIKTDEGL